MLTISDGVFHGTRTDDSGRVLAEALEEAGFEVAERMVVQDDRRDIEPAIVDLTTRNDLLLTTGGTGLGPRDVTPEATLAVIEREAPGFAEAMRADGRAKTPMAILSRGVSGVLNDALVVNFPGSPKACLEGLQVVLPLFGHALDLITGHTQHKDGPPKPKERPGETDLTGSTSGADVHSGHSHDGSPGSSGTQPAVTTSGATAPQADPAWDVTSELARRIGQGEDSLLATAIRREGSPPCSVGQKMLLGPGGPLTGTLGCSDFDTAIANEAAQVLAAGTSTVRTLKHDLGTVDVYLEPYTRRPRLVVIGATPVALWLLRWGKDLGYETILIEDRSDWITPEHREAATRVESSAGGLQESGTALDVVHTDHESPSVPNQVAALLRLRPRFVGIIGSARHTGHHIQQLRDAGVDPEQIGQIQSPVGLNLGAKTPPEIALSILAGLMRHRTGRSAEWLDRRFERARVDESPALR